MIFEHTTIQQLEALLRPHMGKPVWPGITSAEAKKRGAEYAKRTGLWERIAQAVRPDEPAPLPRFADYQHYHRVGSRQPYQSQLERMLDAINMAALALWLDHPAGNVDHLQNLLMAQCGVNWEMPAHKGVHIELWGTRVGRHLAEYSWLFADRLDEPVRQRISEEVNRRMLNVALDWRQPDWWNTNENNWNLVCNADLVQMAMYEVQDSMALATFVHTLCRRMDYAINYFPADGGCPEGPGYWDYGVGHFLMVALALRERSGGAIDLADDPHVRQICRFPLAMQLRGSHRASFADAQTNEYFGAQTVLQVKVLTGASDLLRVVEPLPGNDLKLDSIRALSIYNGEKADPTPDRTDYLLPDLQVVKAYAGDTVLAVTAGNNGVSHNHNDIGSFILMVGENRVITDPGYPICNSQTFGPKRYEMFFCRSKGHAVPLINGHEQSFGAQFSSTLRATGLNGPGDKIIDVEMAGAYADPTLKRLSRRFVLQPNGAVQLTDEYTFTAMPTALEEAFITFEDFRLEKDASAVHFVGGGVLEAQQPGKFTVQTLTPEQHVGMVQRPIHRIAFTPAKLAETMRLAFKCHA